MIANPAIVDLAERIDVPADPSPITSGQLRASLTITTHDGRSLASVQEHHRGSAENPISRGDVEAKFEANTKYLLSPAQQRTLRSMIDDVAELRSVERLVDACICERLE
jgi:2-methylcitrate dehydratase PrpD